MGYLIFGIVWWLIGSGGTIYLLHKSNDIKVEDIPMIIYMGLLGIFAIFIGLIVLHGDGVILKKRGK